MQENVEPAISRTGNRSIHSLHHHHGWDNSIIPALTIAPGETVSFDMIDASGGQLSAKSTIEAIENWDFKKVNPVTGPVFVDGASPGDALTVTIIDASPSPWGWTGNFPGFGLLSDQFPEPALYHWTCDPTTLAPAAFSRFARVPLKPFAGTIGVALAEPGHHSVVPPRRVGGNLDMRDLAAGAELFLPIEVPGALFSIGDGHAAQGDGEVCGSAIETPMKASVRIDLIKGANLRWPRATVTSQVTRHLDGMGYDVTVGIAPDLMQAARVAVSEMIELLTARQGMTAVEAYMLCSVCLDLRISEIVDQPNWVVAAYMPRIVFE